MYLDGIYAVLFGITFLNGLTWQFARLSAEYNAGVETQGNGRGHHKTATFDAHDFSYAFIFVQLAHLVGYDAQAVGTLE